MFAQYGWLIAALAIAGGCASNDYDRPAVVEDGSPPDTGLGLPDAGRPDVGGPDTARPDADPPAPDAMPDGGRDAASDARSDAATDARPDAPTPDAGPLDPVASLEMARALPDGEAEVRVGPVLVTAIKPAVARDGSDPEHAGFFVQASAAGPALYVDVDPATLSPSPRVGDLVRFKVLEMGTLYTQRRATAIEALTVTGSGDVDATIQNVDDAADLVDGLNGYESELVTGTVTLDASFVFAGAGYLAANSHTDAITEAAGSIRLRMPAAEVSAVLAEGELGAGCTIPFTGPVWRFNGVVQLAVYEASSLGEIVCPGPQVVGAFATDATHVSVRFDRAIDPTSIIAPAAQFDIDGVTVSDAVVDEDVVALTTSALAGDTSYTVTVAATVRDLRGAGVDREHATASFMTMSSEPTGGRLVINEIDYDIVGTENVEFVELYNAGDAPVSLNGLALVLVNGSGMREYGRVALPDAMLPAHAFLVLGSSLVSTPAMRIDLHVAENALQNGSPDGVALIDTVRGTLLDALAYEGDMVGVTMTGMTGTLSLVEGARCTAEDVNSANGSLCRSPEGADTNDASADWAFCTTLTPGTANVR